MSRATLEVADIIRTAGDSFWQKHGSHHAWPHARRKTPEDQPRRTGSFDRKLTFPNTYLLIGVQAVFNERFAMSPIEKTEVRKFLITGPLLDSNSLIQPPVDSERSRDGLAFSIQAAIGIWLELHIVPYTS
jgi:hypothetical protein